MTDLIGRTIAGKFAIESLIGQGAMGAVYRARQIALDKTVAIKVMHGDRAREPTLVARCRREARAASSLDHVHSIRVLDFGEDGDGLLYIAMEYFPGQPLSTIVSKGRPPDVDVIVDALSQALSAIAAAHTLGIVHRDLKPDNILVLDGVDEDGRSRLVVKVCDFGIAHVLEGRSFGTKAPSNRLTTDGIVLGTPYYMSPEQARGQALDARSDIYSMGVILYELLTGEVPFDGSSAFDVALAHCFQEPEPPRRRVPAADAGLEAICLRAMQKDPAARYSTAREMRTAVRALTSSPMIESARETQPAFVPMPTARSVQIVVPPAATTASGAASSRPSPSGPLVADSPEGPPEGALLDAPSPGSAPHASRFPRLGRAHVAGVAVLLVASCAVVFAVRRAPGPRLSIRTAPVGPSAGSLPNGDGDSPVSSDSLAAHESAAPTRSAGPSPLASSAAALASAAQLSASPAHGRRSSRLRPQESTDDHARSNASRGHPAEDESPLPALAPPSVASAAADSPVVAPLATAAAVPAPRAGVGGGDEAVQPPPAPAAPQPHDSFDPSRARVEWAVTSTGGGATPAAFRHSLMHAAAEWTTCYRDALARAGHVSSGMGTVRVSTDEEGNVVRASLDGFSLPGLAPCLDRATRVHVDGVDTGSAWAEIRATFDGDGSK